jgi:hypothetical protein
MGSNPIVGSGRLLFRYGMAVVITAVLVTMTIVVSCQKQEPNGTESGTSAADAPIMIGPALFDNVTASTGINFTYRNGEESGHYAILESLGGGVVLIDYDGDGLLDIFIPGGGHYDKTEAEYKKNSAVPPRILGYPPRLYKNLGNFKFKDVTKEVGLDQALFYTHGGAVLDYNRDGWPDLLVTGYGRVALYRNEADPNAPGGRRFVDVTKEAGLLREGHFWSTSAGCGDLDGDGFADIYLCQYVNWSWANDPLCPGYCPDVSRDVCPPKRFDAVPHALYRNTGKGGFVDVSKSAGLRFQRADKDYGKGLGVILADFNLDGRPDIYVANDTTDNFLYRNKTTKPGELDFEEVGGPLFVAKDDRGQSNGSMGVVAGDYDGSGLPSIWVTNYENELHALYRNKMVEGRQHFLYSTRVSGIAAIGQLFVGWGTCFLDTDNRGLLDIFVSNGHVIHHPCGSSKLAQEPVLLRNLGGGKFKKYREENASRPAGYLDQRHRGRGLAVGDLDNDGLPDLVISHNNEPVSVLRNISTLKNHWLGIDLRGKDRRDIVGARLVLDVNGQKLTRFATGGGSYASSFDPRHLFGLGKNDKAGRLTVYWPSAEPRVEHFDGLAVDRYHRLEQGTGKEE